MMGSQGGGSQSSPGGGKVRQFPAPSPHPQADPHAPRLKRSGTSALRPVTIHQLHSATQAFAEAEFYVDNAELKDVSAATASCFEFARCTLG